MKAGTFLGIVFKVNPFFLLLMALAFGLGQLLPALVLFVIVLFHELAHALAASAYGLRVAEVELLPFGGVARIDHVLEFDPKIEIGVALAGPLSNLLFAAVLWLWQTRHTRRLITIGFYFLPGQTLVWPPLTCCRDCPLMVAGC